MSKVAQISVEDATQHGKKSLKELSRLIVEIQADINEPVAHIVIMSAQQFNRINLLLHGNDVFVGTIRSLVGRLLATVQRTNPHHHPLIPVIDQMVALVTGQRAPAPAQPEPARALVAVPDEARPPEPGEQG